MSATAAARDDRSSHPSHDRWWLVLTAFCTSLIHLGLQAAAYAFVMRHVYRAYPAGTAEFVRELHRPTSELVIWAMAVTSLSMGVFITTVMEWSGAKTVTAGLKRGVVLGLLFWTAVNSGLYASSHVFSLPSILVDTPMSALCMALGSGFAVWMLHVRHTITS